MKTTIDAAERLVIPKAGSAACRLTPGMPIKVRYRVRCIELEPEPMVVEMVRQGRLTVAVPKSSVPALARLPQLTLIMSVTR